jgi:hypothetical protein
MSRRAGARMLPDRRESEQSEHSCRKAEDRRDKNPPLKESCASELL